jgi:hypothetical protein
MTEGSGGTRNKLQQSGTRLDVSYLRINPMQRDDDTSAPVEVSGSVSQISEPFRSVVDL